MFLFINKTIFTWVRYRHLYKMNNMLGEVGLEVCFCYCNDKLLKIFIIVMIKHFLGFSFKAFWYIVLEYFLASDLVIGVLQICILRFQLFKCVSVGVLSLVSYWAHELKRFYKIFVKKKKHVNRGNSVKTWPLHCSHNFFLPRLSHKVTFWDFHSHHPSENPLGSFISEYRGGEFVQFRMLWLSLLF